MFEASIRNYGPDRQRLSQASHVFFDLRLLQFTSDEDRAVRIANCGQSLSFPLGWGGCSIVKILTLFKDKNNVFII